MKRRFCSLLLGSGSPANAKLPLNECISFLFSLAFEPRHIIERLLLKLQRIVKDGKEHWGYHKSSYGSHYE